MCGKILREVAGGVKEHKEGVSRDEEALGRLDLIWSCAMRAIRSLDALQTTGSLPRCGRHHFWRWPVQFLQRGYFSHSACVKFFPNAVGNVVVRLSLVGGAKLTNPHEPFQTFVMCVHVRSCQHVRSRQNAIPTLCPK
jgi:hypothetical protein